MTTGYAVDVTLRGLSPLLFNRMTEKARAGKLRKDELLDEAERRVYRDANGALVWPAWNIQVGLVDGARLGKVKLGRGSIVPYVSALVAVEADGAFGRKDFDGLDQQWGRIPPKTGAMVMLFRPKLNAGWLLRFRLNVYDATIDPDLLQQIVQYAGIYAGFGSWRPRFGRFEIAEWKVANAAKPKR